MSKDKLYLLDAHALCYRTFYAIRNLATSKGEATNAVYGFVNTIRKILRVYQPEYMAVCFDSPKKTYRQEKFAEYKIQRPKMPDDLISQMPLIKEVVQAYNLAIFEFGGFEADDIIATLCKQGVKNDVEVVIISDDKDMYQLASEKVKFLSAKSDDLLGYQDIRQKLGFEPERIVDFISLAGDKTDNIPGIFGVGEVTAEKLIQEFGSLEEIFKNIDKVKPEKLREKITQNKNTALLSKELAILETRVPFDLNLPQLKVEAPDKPRLLDIFKRLEFKKFAEELIEPEDNLEAATALKPVEKISEIKAYIEKIKQKHKFAFLLDIANAEGNKELKGIAVSCGESDVFYVGPKLIKELKVIFSERGITKITFDIKEVLKILSDSGYLGEIKPIYAASKDNNATVYTVKNELTKPTVRQVSESQFVEENTFDVMLAAYLLSPGRSSYELTDLAWDYFGRSVASLGLGDKVSLLNQLYPVLSGELKKKSLSDLFEKVEIPLAYTLFGMENQGVKIDLKLLKELSGECEGKIEELQQKLYRLAGEEFNINSPKQLSKILFEKLKLPVIKKTKTGFSTDEDVLNRLAPKHEFPAIVLEYRLYAKLKSTYIDTLPELVDRKTQRIHASFNQTGTETGRLSSSNPNLQNIPVKTELGRQVRRAFIPSDENMEILAADYSQIELRILAHLAGDETLKKAFEKDLDIHGYTASLVFDTAEDKITKEMRNYAKRVNFGIIYGMSAFGLAKELGVSNQEAQEFIDKYFARYPKVKDFMDKCIKECEEKGYATTILNRRRYIPEINNKNLGIRQFAQRQAINTPVQGSAADLIKLAMIEVQRELEGRDLKSKMIITVHDELVFEVVKSEKEQAIAVIKEKMENAFKLTVPIKVTVKSGNNWLEMKELL